MLTLDSAIQECSKLHDKLYQRSSDILTRENILPIKSASYQLFKLGVKINSLCANRMVRKLIRYVYDDVCKEKKFTIEDMPNDDQDDVKAKQLDLLSEMYARVIVTRNVWHKLHTAYNSDTGDKLNNFVPSWLYNHIYHNNELRANIYYTAFNEIQLFDMYINNIRQLEPDAIFHVFCNSDEKYALMNDHLFPLFAQIQHKHVKLESRRPFSVQDKLIQYDVKFVKYATIEQVDRIVHLIKNNAAIYDFPHYIIIICDDNSSIDNDVSRFLPLFRSLNHPRFIAIGNVLMRNSIRNVIDEFTVCPLDVIGAPIGANIVPLSMNDVKINQKIPTENYMLNTVYNASKALVYNNASEIYNFILKLIENEPNYKSRIVLIGDENVICNMQIQLKMINPFMLVNVISDVHRQNKTWFSQIIDSYANSEYISILLTNSFVGLEPYIDMETHIIRIDSTTLPNIMKDLIVLANTAVSKYHFIYSLTTMLAEEMTKSNSVYVVNDTVCDMLTSRVCMKQFMQQCVFDNTLYECTDRSHVIFSSMTDNRQNVHVYACPRCINYSANPNLLHYDEKNNCIFLTVDQLLKRVSIQIDSQFTHMPLNDIIDILNDLNNKSYTAPVFAYACLFCNTLVRPKLMTFNLQNEQIIVNINLNNAHVLNNYELIVHHHTNVNRVSNEFNQMILMRLSKH
jgi:hypothetical protein